MKKGKGFIVGFCLVHCLHQFDSKIIKLDTSWFSAVSFNML